jgi:integrase
MASERTDEPTGKALTALGALIADEDSAELLGLVEEARARALDARPPNTELAYAKAWAQYAAFCEQFGLPLLQCPESVALYLTWKARDREERTEKADGTIETAVRKGVKVATLRVHMAAIVVRHRDEGLELDLRAGQAGKTIEGLMRKGARELPRRADPVDGDALFPMAATFPRTGVGARDRAMFLLGFGAGLRRSELVALDVGDLDLRIGRGVQLRIRSSKTDQKGEGEVVSIHAASDPDLDALDALWHWFLVREFDTDRLKAGEYDKLPLFTAFDHRGLLTAERVGDRAVVRMIKAAARRAGLDPESFSGHSLRAGMATMAAEADAPLLEIAGQGRWKSLDTVRKYVRSSDSWRNRAGTLLDRASERGAASGMTLPPSEGGRRRSTGDGGPIETRTQKLVRASLDQAIRWTGEAAKRHYREAELADVLDALSMIRPRAEDAVGGTAGWRLRDAMRCVLLCLSERRLRERVGASGFAADLRWLASLRPGTPRLREIPTDPAERPLAVHEMRIADADHRKGNAE